jgi:hypothetical protein
VIGGSYMLTGDFIAGMLCIIFIFLAFNCSSYYIHRDVSKKFKGSGVSVSRYNFFNLLRIKFLNYVGATYFCLNLLCVLSTLSLLVIMSLCFCGVVSFILVQIFGAVWLGAMLIFSFWLSKYFN